MVGEAGSPFLVFGRVAVSTHTLHLESDTPKRPHLSEPSMGAKLKWVMDSVTLREK